MTEIDERNRPEDRDEMLNEWDEELLVGGVMLSEFATFLIQDADRAFCAGADLAALFAAQAAMEAHLRYEYGSQTKARAGFAALIDDCPLTDEVRERLHVVRRYRNRWGHVRDPEDDTALIERPDEHRAELALMTTRAMRLLRELIYVEQCV